MSGARTVLLHDPRLERLAPRLLRLLNRPEMFFVQGHISPHPTLLSIPMKRVTIVRNPLQRLISHFCYSFERRFYDPSQLQFFRARTNYTRACFDGGDLIAWIEAFKMDDFQVRFLSSHYDRPLSEASEILAHDVLRSLDFVATTETLGELFHVLSALTGKRFNQARTPHTNKSDKSRLRVSREDLAFVNAHFCQRDDRLLRRIAEHKDAMYESCVNSVRETIDAQQNRNISWILESMLSGVAVNELMFRLKRKSVGLTTYGLHAVSNILTRK